MPTRGDIVIADANNIWSKLPLGAAYSQMFVNSAGTGAEWSVRCRNSMARAYLAANQTGVGDASWTKCNLANETFDIGSNYDTTNKRYVAPVSGYYQVDATLNLSNAGTVITIGSVMIYVNGTNYTQGTQIRVVTAHTAILQLSVSALVYAAAGQYIELYGFVDTSDGSTTSFGGDANGLTSVMSVFLVSI